MENDIKYIPVVAHIKNTETGEIRKFTDTNISEENGILNPFWWTKDGNAGCDCNRGMFFARAGEDEDQCWESYPCNIGDNKYLVNLYREDNGELFYKEY